MSGPTYYGDPTWPYFVRIVLANNKSLWYTAKFLDNSYPNQAELQAIIECLKLNRASLAQYTDLADMKNTGMAKIANLMGIGNNHDDSTIAMFVQYKLLGPQMIVVPHTTMLDPHFVTTRLVDGQWPAGSKPVMFLSVPLPPIRNIGSGSARAAAGSTLPAIPGAQPAATRQPVSARGVHVADSRRGGNARVLVAGAPPAAGGFVAQPPARRPAPDAPSTMIVTNVDNAHQSHSVCIKVIKGDIVTLAVSENVEAVVNAANSESFTPSDDGISGALRDAMYPRDVYEDWISFKNNRSSMSADVRKATEERINLAKATADQGEYQVCGTRKTQQDGSPVATIPECGAAWQYANGYLKDFGVTHVIHAVGPKWMDNDFYDDRTRSMKRNTFDTCSERLDKTITNALNLAISLKVKSIAIPVISGGIFCHQDEPLKRREQEKAVALLIANVKELAQSLPASSVLKVIYIVEIDPTVVRDIQENVNNIVSEQNDVIIARMRNMVTPVPGGGGARRV